MCGDPDHGDLCYYHWLAAQENLVAEQDLASAGVSGSGMVPLAMHPSDIRQA